MKYAPNHTLSGHTKPQDKSLLFFCIQDKRLVLSYINFHTCSNVQAPGSLQTSLFIYSIQLVLKFHVQAHMLAEAPW